MDDSSPIWELVSPYLEGVKKSGSDNVVARCPFHDDRSPSFAINIRNGAWICYAGCGAGHIKSFLKRVGKSYKQIDNLVGPLQDRIDSEVRRARQRKKARFRTDLFHGEHVLPEAVLGPYDYCPTYLTVRGFDADLLRSLDIGYDSRNGRITFPIRDLYGNLVGISGRSDTGDQPRYKFYKRGFRDRGEYYPGDFGPNFDDEFRDYDIDKSRFLWNADKAITWMLASDDATTPLIIVEGFKACLWLIQCGFKAVALMGSSMSTIQADLVRRVGNPVIFFLDNDGPGRKATRRYSKLIAKSNLQTFVVQYPTWADVHTQPDDLSKKGLQRVICDAKRWTWAKKITTAS